MSKLWLVKGLTGLSATDEESESVLRKLGRGELVKCEIKKPRNVKFHRKFFALLKLIAENSPGNVTTDYIRSVIMQELGYGVEYGRRDGRVIWFMNKSISFGSMDETEFGQFWEQAVKVVHEVLLPGIDSEELNMAVEDLIG